MAAASRRKSQPAPPHVVFEALTQPDRDPSRPWLQLLPREVRPRIVRADAPHLLVWSSLWIAHPTAQVRIDIVARTQDSGTDLTWTLLLAEPLREPDEVAALRKRLNQLINGDLRATFDQ